LTLRLSHLYARSVNSAIEWPGFLRPNDLHANALKLTIFEWGFSLGAAVIEPVPSLLV
jgi:hypothetical protein